MRTRLLFQLFILSIGSSFAGASEYITFTEGNTLNVPAGKTALILHFLPSSDANGSVQIILETSIDLITWNVASPGSYASSNPSRFFRVRAVAP